MSKPTNYNNHIQHVSSARVNEVSHYRNLHENSAVTREMFLDAFIVL